MLRAIDKNKKSVFIDDVDENEICFCPICNQPLIQKRGKIRAHHFSHMEPMGSNSKNYTLCSDHWHYDKTEWHIQWQRRFPKECCEKVLKREAEKHIADVLINGLVIEFQHSSISIEEFRARNMFYNACGYNVIWVFDFIEEFEDGKISCSNYKENEYNWIYVKKMFKDINLKTEAVTVLFQFSNDEEDAVLERVTNSYKEFERFYTDLEHALSIREFVEHAKQNNFSFHKNNDSQQITQEILSKIKDGKTIYELWSPDYCWMLVQNRFNGKVMLIKGTKGEMWRERNENYGRIIGKYSNLVNGKYRYSEDYPVINAEKPIWRLIKVENRTDPEYVYRNVDDNNPRFLDCMKLSTIVNQTRKESIIVRCLANNITYQLNIVNSGYGRRNFNSFTLDTETGEIGQLHQNNVVMVLFDKKVWVEL